MIVRRLGHCLALATLLAASSVSAEPTFVNGLVIGGGTLEIQYNIIAERILGLPR